MAFLTINPLSPGHTLVVPRAEVDHWLDMPPALNCHLTNVGSVIGQAMMQAFSPAKIGALYAGLEVPHCHLHLVPINGVHDLDFDKADPDPDPADLDAAADKIRAALRNLKREEVAD